MNSSPPFASPVNELFSLDAEQALLGAILYDNEVYYAVADTLNADHFYDPFHGRIYAFCGKLITAGQLASPLTLRAKLEGDDAFIEAGGERYLVQFAQSVPTTVGAADYGRLITDYWTRRQIVDAGRQMIEAASTADIDDDPQKQLEQAASKLASLAEKQSTVIDHPRQVDRWLEDVQAVQRGEAVVSVPSGVPHWDRRVGGLIGGRFYVIGGRPGMGKSIFGCAVAKAVAQSKRGALFFSLEMPAREVHARICADIAFERGYEIPFGQITDGPPLPEFDQERLFSIGIDYRSLPFRVVDTPALTAEAITIQSMRAQRYFAKMGKPLGVIVVDYLQIMGVAQPTGNVVTDHGRKATALKNLAKQLDVAVVAMAQLSRAVEQRDDKRPRLSDLRESGQIEQDADVITFLKRPEYYLQDDERADQENEEHAAWQGDMAAAKGRLDLITAKFRGGETGFDMVGVRPEFSAIRERAA